MAHTYEELKHMTVAQLREIADGLEEGAIEGASQMNKEHVLEAICGVLKIDMHTHHVASGIDKSGIKGKIKELKVARKTAADAKDAQKLNVVRNKIRRLKRQLRKAAV